MTDIATIFLEALKGPRRPAAQEIEITLCNRVFPRSHRPKAMADPVLPEVFRKIPETLLGTLPLRAAIGPGTFSKERLFDLFNESVVALEKRYQESAKLLLMVVACNIEVRGKWMSDKRLFGAMKAKFEEWKDKLPRFEFERPPALSLELYKQPEMAIVASLGSALGDACHELVRKFADALDHLVDLEQVGLLEWISEDACRYHFFRNVLLSETTASHTTVREEMKDAGTRRDRVTTTEREAEETHRHARHISELIGAKNYTLRAAEGVKKPGRVNALIEVIPEWLKPCMRVITGKQTQHVTIERDLRTEKTSETEVTVKTEAVYRPDPAVACGLYVLAGWDDETEDKTPAQVFHQLHEPKK